MRVTVIQKDIMWGEVQRNLASFSECIDRAPKSDIYVLPEMFSTGFISTESGLCEKEEEAEGLAWMRETAARTRAVVAGSIALQLSAGPRVNRMYWVTPDGNVSFYDKKHLFGDESNDFTPGDQKDVSFYDKKHLFGDESNDFTPGDQKVIVEYQGIRFLLAICYDLRFPVWLRNREGYDAMIIPASWPASRRRAWDILLQARAIENHCYVFACNRVGKDPVASYTGGSIILDPQGIEVTCATDGAEDFCSAELDMYKIEQARKRLLAIKDYLEER